MSDRARRTVSRSACGQATTTLKLRKLFASSSVTVVAASTLRNMAVASPVRSGLLGLEWPTGAPAPVLPGAVDAVGARARRDLVHLAGREELDLTHTHTLLLLPSLDL